MRASALAIATLATLGANAGNHDVIIAGGDDRRYMTIEPKRSRGRRSKRAPSVIYKQGEGGRRADQRLQAKLDLNAKIYADTPVGLPSRQVLRQGLIRSRKQGIKAAKRLRDSLLLKALRTKPAAAQKQAA